eukprot:TRINITY_DN6995_c0_g1_i3.p1 TRINITY_DN6995_c0_g1~~TRINITY_DN6995_c0_g1_i3.p1  ORF type:complete len:242 (+),score=33.35 TRINITY_DN6995_c0_g1_i3:94-726(+)
MCIRDRSSPLRRIIPSGENSGSKFKVPGYFEKARLRRSMPAFCPAVSVNILHADGDEESMRAEKAQESKTVIRIAKGSVSGDDSALGMVPDAPPKGPQRRTAVRRKKLSSSSDEELRQPPKELAATSTKLEVYEQINRIYIAGCPGQTYSIGSPTREIHKKNTWKAISSGMHFAREYRRLLPRQYLRRGMRRAMFQATNLSTIYEALAYP